MHNTRNSSIENVMKNCIKKKKKMIKTTWDIGGFAIRYSGLLDCNVCYNIFYAINVKRNHKLGPYTNKDKEMEKKI